MTIPAAALPVLQHHLGCHRIRDHHTQGNRAPFPCHPDAEFARWKDPYCYHKIARKCVTFMLASFSEFISMADPNWIQKTAVLSLVLGGPAIFLLAQVFRRRAQPLHGRAKLSLWMAIAFIATFFCWFVSVMFELSVSLMVGWPLLGILMSCGGCLLALFPETENRLRLESANPLLLLLALTSLVAPN
jgi:hypothetical protein